jgi:hypothetical protein
VAVEGTLNGWLQLTDSSPLNDEESAELAKWFMEYRKDDPNCEKEEALWSGDNKVIPFSITFWDGWPPCVWKDLEQLCGKLKKGSWILFHYTTRNMYFNYTMQSILVNQEGVRSTGDPFMDDPLMQIVGGPLRGEQPEEKDELDISDEDVDAELRAYDPSSVPDGGWGDEGYDDEVDEVDEDWI